MQLHSFRPTGERNEQKNHYRKFLTNRCAYVRKKSFLKVFLYMFFRQISPCLYFVHNRKKTEMSSNKKCSIWNRVEPHTLDFQCMISFSVVFLSISREMKRNLKKFHKHTHSTVVNDLRRWNQTHKIPKNIREQKKKCVKLSFSSTWKNSK